MPTRRSALLAVLIVPLVAVLTACSSSSGSHPPKASTTTAPLAGASATHTVARSTSALERWYRSAIGPLNQINHAIVSAQRAVNQHDSAALHTTCLALRHSVTNFDKVRSAPDHPVDTAIRRAVSDFRMAADDCLSRNLDPAGRLVLRGQHAVGVAAHRVDTLT